MADYNVIASGLGQPFAGIILSWSISLLVSGLMVAGWKGIILQLIILIIPIVV